jgi:beta-lactamase regulating signal transducer with metallopeptidase domain
MAFGAVKAAILIPAIGDSWSPDRRRAVLLHELAHVGRRDCLTQMLAAVVCAVYWVHPGAWWMARRLRVERELACDDLVLSAGTSPRDYAGHLLEIAYALRTTFAPALSVSMASPRQLEGRMLALLDAARNRTIPTLRTRLAATLIMMALLVPVAAATVTSAPATPAVAVDAPLVAAEHLGDPPGAGVRLRPPSNERRRRLLRNKHRNRAS